MICDATNGSSIISIIMCCFYSQIILKMKIYNLLKRKDNQEHYNFNLIPYCSFFWGNDYCYLNVGWLNICFQFKIK